MENVITAKSWSQLQEALFSDSWNASLQRFRSPYVYRGLSDKDYQLETSLMRMGGSYQQLERHLLRNFRKYGRNLSAPSFWHLLSIAQHHGLPSRLLDWTYSPYIALHFALANYEKFNIDGIIWMVNFEEAHRLLPDSLRHSLDEEGAQAFTVELLASLSHGAGPADDSSFHDVVQSLNEFDELGAEEEFLLFFEPPSIDERIVNQFALFSVIPNPARAVDDWLQKHPQLFRKVIIPAAKKWEYRDMLDQCNITERVLFPGLDGLSSWLRRHYSPRA